MILKQLREKYHFTQTEVARKIGINVRNYNRYENGTVEPDIATLVKLAEFFHTSIDNIVGRDTQIIDLNAIEPLDSKLIKKILQLNKNYKDKVDSYIDGLLES